ncbi:MAG: XRE family transcriptional regulator [Ignavibacteriota bacterium]
MKTTYISVLRELEKNSPIWEAIGNKKLTQMRWIKNLRWGLNMSARQLGKRMGIASQTVRDMERRETEESMTIGSLRKAANAFELDLFYLFIPKNPGSNEKPLQGLIEKRAREMAHEIIMRSNMTMRLEDQETEPLLAEEKIQALTSELKNNLPPSAWE